MKQINIVVCLSVCAAVVMSVPAGFFALEESEVKPVVRFALQQLGSNYSLVEVIDKQAQLVAGILYRLTLKVKVTQSNKITRLETCYMEVHVQAWINYKKITASKCVQYRGKTRKVEDRTPSRNATNRTTSYGTYRGGILLHKAGHRAMFHRGGRRAMFHRSGHRAMSHRGVGRQLSGKSAGHRSLYMATNHRMRNYHARRRLAARRRNRRW